MRKVLCLLVLLVLVVGCQLNKNPFLGSWRTDWSGMLDPGDYTVITFCDDDTFHERGQLSSTVYALKGYYNYTDTILTFDYGVGYLPASVHYTIYDNTMVWEGSIYFYRE